MNVYSKQKQTQETNQQTPWKTGKRGRGMGLRDTSYRNEYILYGTGNCGCYNIF